MLPKRMNEFLRDLLPDEVWQTRRIEENGLCYLEFTSQDVELLHRLGIEVDNLGPRLVACMWNEREPQESADTSSWTTSRWACLRWAAFVFRPK